MASELAGVVKALAASSRHGFSKETRDQIEVVAGEGVVGDAHAGTKVQHLSRVKANPDQPNLRQVHLIASELFDELQARGFAVQPGDLGENILTSGLDLLALPRGTRLLIGQGVALEVTGLRNPCGQIEHFMPGLLAAVLGRDDQGGLIRKAGIMAIALTSGVLEVGDNIAVELPQRPHLPLEVV